MGFGSKCIYWVHAFAERRYKGSFLKFEGSYIHSIAFQSVSLYFRITSYSFCTVEGKGTEFGHLFKEQTSLYGVGFLTKALLLRDNLNKMRMKWTHVRNPKLKSPFHRNTNKLSPVETLVKNSSYILTITPDNKFTCKLYKLSHSHEWKSFAETKSTTLMLSHVRIIWPDLLTSKIPG